MPLNDELFKETNPAPLKYAMYRLMGKINPDLRLPVGSPPKSKRLWFSTE
jgi:4-hydroxy-tetrahydrodipicolinate synthase